MAATSLATPAREGHYFTVLQRQARLLGDYEEVHLRKSSVAPPTTSIKPPGPSPTRISIAPRRPTRSHKQYVHFNKVTASQYLKQTEPHWMKIHLSRQEATELLLDRPVGSFLVRGSQRAKYALSLRIMSDDMEETAVKHFLIQINQQKFLTIQGSNLPFISIYDLLAYFCFKQSGGMPCCLKPPNPAVRESSKLDGSDSSDSDSEEDVAFSIPPIPPRTASMGRGGEIAGSANSGEILTKKRVAPPKPPRPMEGWDENGEGSEEELRRGEDPMPDKVFIRRRSKSSEGFMEKSRVDKNADVSTPTSETTSSTNQIKRKVLSLIERFETTSPKKTHTSFSESRVSTRKEYEQTNLRVLSPLDPGIPVPPPKPRTTIPLVPPRPLSTECGDEGVPILPPRTPAPLLPPKPPGSMPPAVSPRGGTHRRSHSDSEPRYMEKFPISPPKIPPKTRLRMPGYEMMPSNRLSMNSPTSHIYSEATVTSTNHPEVEEDWVKLEKPDKWAEEREESGVNGDNMMMAEVEINTTKGAWQPEGSGGNKGTKWRPKPLGWAKKLHFRHGKHKPRKRLRKFILELSSDQSQEFGQRISEFITEMRARNTEPHQKMLLEIRNFITAMHEHLLQYHQNDLNNCGMEGCDNSSHVVECTLQECILGPLSHFVYLRIEEYYATNGDLFQVQRSIHQGKLKTTEEMGIRPHLIVPSEKVISEMISLLSRMMKTTCAISKLEYLLEVVRLTYENIRDSRQPKKIMNDLGADDFLPIFVWVLVQCGFTRAEIEAEYMWGLAHPSLFNGEGGYYLTTLTSAISVLKELITASQPAALQQQLPTMNNLQTELKVYFEDEHTGQYSSAYYLPIVPTMTAAEICEIIVERRQITNPEDYSLFIVVDGKATRMDENEKPQEIKLKWTLQRTLEQSVSTTNHTPSTANHTPSSQFFAYKLKLHS